MRQRGKQRLNASTDTADQQVTPDDAPFFASPTGFFPIEFQSSAAIHDGRRVEWRPGRVSFALGPARTARFDLSTCSAVLRNRANKHTSCGLDTSRVQHRRTETICGATERRGVDVGARLRRRRRHPRRTCAWRNDIQWERSIYQQSTYHLALMVRFGTCHLQIRVNIVRTLGCVQANRASLLKSRRFIA